MWYGLVRLPFIWSCVALGFGGIPMVYHLIIQVRCQVPDMGHKVLSENPLQIRRTDMSEPNDVHRDREVVWRNPKDLKLHPAHERFPELDPVFYQAMREDIRVHDIRVPLEILLDDTVIAGKTRRGMAIELGKKLVPCVIRHDLTGASSSKVIRALEADNLNRRQLDKLALARLHETLRHGPADESTEDHLERWERRKQVAKLLGDERTKRRWFNASKLQGYLEDCFKRGTITLVQAEKSRFSIPSSKKKSLSASRPRKRQRRSLQAIANETRPPRQRPCKPC